MAISSSLLGLFIPTIGFGFQVNIKNTLLYTQLVTVGEDKGFICKIAKTPTEAVALIEEGFELHCCYDEKDEIKLFRKRK